MEIKGAAVFVVLINEVLRCYFAWYRRTEFLNVRRLSKINNSDPPPRVTPCTGRFKHSCAFNASETGSAIVANTSNDRVCAVGGSRPAACGLTDCDSDHLGSCCGATEREDSLHPQGLFGARLVRAFEQFIRRRRCFRQCKEPGV